MATAITDLTMSATAPIFADGPRTPRAARGLRVVVPLVLRGVFHGPLLQRRQRLVEQLTH